MDVINPLEHVHKGITYAFDKIENLKHLQPGDYFVAQEPSLGTAKVHGRVRIERKGFLTTSFEPFSPEAGPEWDGELISRFRMMADGVFRASGVESCGQHRLYLLRTGVIKVFIRFEDRPAADMFVYWLKGKESRKA